MSALPRSRVLGDRYIRCRLDLEVPRASAREEDKRDEEWVLEPKEMWWEQGFWLGGRRVRVGREDEGRGLCGCCAGGRGDGVPASAKADLAVVVYLGEEDYVT